jgi:hypothetical protein
MIRALFSQVSGLAPSRLKTIWTLENATVSRHARAQTVR